MTTSRTEDGVRVQIKRSGETGTALYGPHEQYGKTWPGHSRGGHWSLPVFLDGDHERIGLFIPSELEPGPSRRPAPTLGSRRVQHRERQQTGTLLESLVFGGITWPALDRGGNLMVPVVLDDGTTRTWRASFIEPAVECEPEPGPAQVPGVILSGPRVMVRDGRWALNRPGRVLYRWAGARDESRIWPDFNDGKWLVPVEMDRSRTVLLIPATDLGPFTEPEPVKATILAEADRVASAIQAKALRDVAEAAVDALELFTSRLRAIALEGDKNAN